MNNISDPNATEMRGWVMLMLQRAAENVNPSECNDPAVLLACSLGSDSCPAACVNKSSDNEKTDSNKNVEDRVIAGDLDVSVVDYSSSIQSAPAGIFVANTLKFGASEKIQLDSLTLKRTGLGSSKAIKKVWLEKNGVAVTNAASVGSDGLAVLNFKANRDTISETTEYELVVELNAGYQGDEFAFDLQSVESTAKNTTISGTTSTYRVSNYEVVKLTANISNANTSDGAGNITPIEYKLNGASDYVIGEFSLQSDSSKDDRDIYVKSLTFKNNGTADFGDTFKNVKVYRDAKVVSNKVEINGKDITISLDEDVIKANRKALYTIRAEVSNLERAGDTVQLYLKDAKDIIADESDTNFRANIEFDTSWAKSDAVKTFINAGELSLYKFNGGKVTFETDANFAKTVNAGVSATDVVIARGKLVVTEPVELPAIVIPYGTWTTTATSGGTTFKPETDTIKRLILKIGDKRYTADPDTAGQFVFKDVTVRGTSDVELLISIGSNEARLDNQTIKFNQNFGKVLMTAGNGSFQNNDSALTPSDIAGALQIATVQIKKPKFSISSTSLDTQETAINNPETKIVMKGKLEAKENTVNVNKVRVKVYSEGSALTASDTVEVTLSIDGSPFATSRALKVGTQSTTTPIETYEFNSIGTIEAGKTLPFEISVAPTIGHQGNIWFDIEAEGTDSNGNATNTSAETSATLEVKGAATVELTSTNTSSRVTKPTNGIVIYEGTLKVSNTSAELTGFALTTGAASTGLTLTNAKLYIDGESVEASVAGLTFTGMTENLEKGSHKVEVKANVTSAAGYTGADYNLNIAGVAYNYDGESKTSSEVSNTYFAKGWFTLSKQSSSSQQVLNVKLSNTSDKTIKISGVTTGGVISDVTVKNTSADQLSANNVVVGAGESIDIQLIAGNSGTARLIGITYTVEDNGIYTYTLDNTNDAVGSWKDFYSIKNN